MNFITAGGVFLQSLVFGYGGVRFNDEGLRLDPLLPPGCRSMKLRGNETALETDKRGSLMVLHFCLWVQSLAVCLVVHVSERRPELCRC